MPSIRIAFLASAKRVCSEREKKKPKSEGNLNVKDQLLLAGELGKAAFHAGKTCSPAKDKEFMQFLRACDNRRVGMAAPGEAPSLALLMAWMRCWQTEQQTAAALPTEHIAASSQSMAEHASQ
jgi:hypothetical protein